MTEYDPLDPSKIGDLNLGLIKSEPGEHFWTLLAMYAIGTNASNDQYLDADTLIGYIIQCFHCEQVWTKAAEKERCPGERDPEMRAAITFAQYLSQPETGE